MDGIYARQSVDKKDSISIETQIQLCKREIQGDDCQIYQDRGYSGSNLNRPDFQRLLRDIRLGKVDRVIVYRLDRMSRSLLDFANLMDLLDQNQATFVSTQEKFDTGTPIGRAMLSITMVFAQLERETIQIRIRDNYYARGEKGMYLGGPPPYGFRQAEDRTRGERIKYLTPVEGEAQAIRQMYQRYGGGLDTLGETARWLNAQGCRSHSGKEWTGSKVSLTLRNPIYVRADLAVYQYYRERGCRISNPPEEFAGTNGCYLYGRRQGSERKYANVQDHVLSLAPSPGLVGSALFLRCQERLDHNLPLGNRGWGTLSWLTGLVKCARCGYAALPKSSNGGRYRYFYCSGRGTGRCGGCGSLGRADRVEAAVEERLFQVAERYSSLRVRQPGPPSPVGNRLRARILTCEDQIQRLIDLALTAEEVTGRYLNQRIQGMAAEKGALEAELDALEEGAEEQVGLSQFRQVWAGLNVRQKSQGARLFLQRVELGEGEMVLCWRHPF